MTPEQAIRDAQKGKLLPVYVVTGEEEHLARRVVSAIREAVLSGGIAGLNDDRYQAGETDAETVVATAKTAPMMATRRLVIVVGAERWEGKAAAGQSAKSARGPLDLLAVYAKDPTPSTVLVVAARKLHGQRRLMSAANKGGYAVACKPLGRRELPSWIRDEARARGHAIPGHIAQTLAELLGPGLGPVADALDRLSLYVGPGQPIDDEAVGQVVTRVRQDTVWQLVSALGRRQVGQALRSLSDAHDPREGGLPVLGAVAWSVRQLLKFEAARRAGSNSTTAARQAGVPPFKVDEVERTVSRVGSLRLGRWLGLVADADRALKGSRRSHRAVLETLVVEMCR